VAALSAQRRSAAIKAITLDLDDTLWPVGPTIERAEHELRNAVAAECPHWAHDFSRLRRESLSRALGLAGDDPALADSAYDVFFAARNRVECFADALPALQALARRWPLAALTNGNADLETIGLAPYFTATISAREFGVAKPDPRIFHEACRQLDAVPHEVLHIGDDWALDVAGAHRAGLRSAWVRRNAEVSMSRPNDAASPDCVVAHLGELVAWLDA